MSTLRTHDLTKSYGGRTVVRGVNLDVASGEIVGLLGPNGAGKTTTFYMTVGLTAPDSGRVELDGHDVTDDPMYIRARKGIGYLPQEPSIFRGLTVEQNILAILETMGLDARDAAGAAARAAGRAEPDAAGAGAGLHAVGRRAPARRDHARAGHLAEVHPARRAVRRHRSDRRHRHPEDHLSPQGSRHRRADHRPQRARDAAHHRSRLHRARRRRSSRAARRTAWRPTTRCGGFIWGPSSGWTKIGLGIASADVRRLTVSSIARGANSCKWQRDNDLADASSWASSRNFTPSSFRS